MEKVVSKEKLICHDCGKQLKENDEVMPYWLKEGDFFKCKECHIIDPVLRNYRPTEVFSRCVGYIRPVQNWNPGKVAEFHDRVTYEIN